jgi:hypothetical protein
MVERAMRSLPLGVILLAACSALTPRSAFDEKLGTGRFAFAWGEGAEWYGYDVLHVADDGECRYVFSELAEGEKEPTWRRHTFTIDSTLLSGLKQEINDAAFVRLSDRHGSEGQHAFIWVRVGGQRELTRVRGTPPPEFVRVADFARDKILGPQRDALAKAKTIDSEEGRAAAESGLDE